MSYFAGPVKAAGAEYVMVPFHLTLDSLLNKGRYSAVNQHQLKDDNGAGAAGEKSYEKFELLWLLALIVVSDTRMKLKIS